MNTKKPIRAMRHRLPTKKYKSHAGRHLSTTAFYACTMKEVLTFLRQLQMNNNREWFHAHKDEYLAAQATFNAFAEELIERIGRFDESVRGLSLKDCTYRIYRDTRFSKDKSPYKTHMGVYVCPGGKKSGFSGYYFHVSSGVDQFGINSHLFAAGDYMADSRVLRVLREDIENGDGDFEAILKQVRRKGFLLDDEFRLKRVPKGFNPEGPYADYLKYKVYCLVDYVDDEFITAPDLAKRVADRFRATKPFLDYLNRAIAYVREEM